MIAPGEEMLDQRKAQATRAAGDQCERGGGHGVRGRPPGRADCKRGLREALTAWGHKWYTHVHVYERRTPN